MDCLIKKKGIILSALLVSTSIATSILSFTTNCSSVVQLSGNTTQTINDIGSVNRGVSVSLVIFSMASALFERHVNIKLIKTENDVDELKSQNEELKSRMTNQNNNTDRNEIFNNEPDSTDTPTSTGRVTQYPTAIIIKK